MSIANYTELVAAVSNWLVRDDLAGLAPDFIALAEAKFNRTLRCVQMEKRAYTAIDMDATEPEFVNLPLDFQAARSICISGLADRPRLQFLTDNQIKDYRSNIGDTAGIPTHYSVFGREMELSPPPDYGYELEIIYRAKLTPLSDSNATNWLLELAPDAYLYGALLEATALMKDDKRIPLWVEGLKQAVDSLNALTQETVV